MRAKFITIAVFGLVFQGCGGGGGNSTNNAGGDTSRLVDGFQVVSSTPTDNVNGVAIDSNIVVELSQSINEESLATVQLLVAPESMADMQHSEDMDMDPMREVTGVPTYNDATRSISFTPDIHLMHATAFHLVLSGIRSANGGRLPVSANTVRFRTLNNPEIRSVRYDTTTGLVEHTLLFTRDSSGNVTRVDSYTGDETTGVLDEFTLVGDDANLPGPPPVAVRSIDFDGATSQIKDYSGDIMQGTQSIARARYDDPGVDTLWNQADDLISSYSQAREEHVTGAAASAMHWITRRFSANNRVSAPWSERATAFSLSSISLRELDDFGRTAREVNYSSLGANGEIDTTLSGDLTVVDDVVTSYRVTSRNAMGMRLSRTSFGSRGRDALPPNPGADGILFTADDVPTEMDVATYNAQDHRTMDVEYDGPGADNNWETTADNTIAHYTLYSYASGTDNLKEQRTFDLGPNAVMEDGLGDDQLIEIETYDPNT